MEAERCASPAPGSGTASLLPHTNRAPRCPVQALVRAAPAPRQVLPPDAAPAPHARPPPPSTAATSHPAPPADR